MSVLMPIGLEPVNDDSEWKNFLKSIVLSYFYVNPESIKLKRSAKIAKARTFAGTVFQPWTNMPDEIDFEGTFYGTRSILDFVVLANAINADPSKKEVKLIYKYRKYPGYVEDITVSAIADKPRVFRYSFKFVSKEATSLWRMMLGNITGAAVEINYINAQVTGAIESLRNEQLNQAASIIVALGFSGGDGRRIMAARLLQMATFAGLFNLSFKRK